MHVYCTDGTVFDCERFDVNEYGLVLYGTEQPEERDRYEEDKSEQIGFVPHDRLWTVLPHGVTPQMEVGPPQGQQSRPPQQPPAAGQQSQGQQSQSQPHAQGPGAQGR